MSTYVVTTRSARNEVNDHGMKVDQFAVAADSAAEAITLATREAARLHPYCRDHRVLNFAKYSAAVVGRLA